MVLGSLLFRSCIDPNPLFNSQLYLSKLKRNQLRSMLSTDNILKQDNSPDE